MTKILPRIAVWLCTIVFLKCMLGTKERKTLHRRTLAAAASKSGYVSNFLSFIFVNSSIYEAYITRRRRQEDDARLFHWRKRHEARCYGKGLGRII